MNLLDNITAQKENYERLKKSIDAEIRQLRSDKLRNAKLEYAKSVLTAWNAGQQNVSAISRAIGTSDRKTVYALLDLAKSVVPQDIISRGESNWNAVVSVDGSRVSAREVPPKWWTFERGMDRPQEPYSGWIDVADYGVVGSSDYPSPLQAEWLYGDGTLREAVDL